jgi:hypothetical protein
MDNVLIYCIGDSFLEDFQYILKEICNPIMFLDSDYFNRDSDLVMKNNFQIVDYKNYDNFVDSIFNALPVSDVIILGNFQFCSSEKLKLKLDELLRKLFISVKCMYPSLMRQRNGNVWIMEPHIKMQDNKFLDMESMVIATKAGIKSLAKIAALELARKNIKVNYILGEVSGYKAKKILEWSLKRKNIYLTAQELTII